MAKAAKSPNSSVVAAKPAKGPTSHIVKKNDDYTSDGVTDADIFLLPGSDYQVMIVVTILAAIVRLFRIYQPSSVVFDEVQYVFLSNLCGPGLIFIFVQFRRVRIEIHQREILHGCSPSPRKTTSYIGWLVSRIRWRIRLQGYWKGLP